MPWKQKPFGWGKVLIGESLFPPVQDATVAVLNQVKEVVDQETNSFKQIVFNVDTTEPPSVELAIQLMLDRANSKLEFECIADSKPSIDPRASTATRPLWKFSRNRPLTAVANPDSVLKRTCAEIAVSSDDCLQSWQLARDHAKQLDTSQIGDLLAVMVFPPPVESDFVSTDWIRRIQLAAAQLATNVEMKHQVSLSDSAVADVTNGPIDWTLDSAMVALAQRATEERPIVDEVRGIVSRVAERVPTEGTWSCRDVAQRVLEYLDTISADGDPTTESTSNS